MFTVEKMVEMFRAIFDNHQDTKTPSGRNAKTLRVFVTSWCGSQPVRELAVVQPGFLAKVLVRELARF